MLEAKGRLKLALEAEHWVEEALSAPGLRLAELTPRIAISSTRLPGQFHGDLADRLLVATARETAATLLTADRAILKYAHHGHLHAMSAET
jgi:PIN domain nuclease of toxin-antitoxin system